MTIPTAIEQLEHAHRLIDKQSVLIETLLQRCKDLTNDVEILHVTIREIVAQRNEALAKFVESEKVVEEERYIREKREVELSAVKERAEKAEAAFLKEREAFGTCATYYGELCAEVGGDIQDPEGTLRKAKAISAEVDKLKARKVKLPTTAYRYYSNDGRSCRQHAIAQCADAIRAAGVEVES